MNSNIEKKVIWSQILSLRFKYLKRNDGLNLKCTPNKFIPLEDISNNFKGLSQIIENKNLQDLHHNISTSDLYEAAKMFLTLNSCPLVHENLYWQAMYGNGPNSRIIMLASNIVKKAKKEFKEKALKLFAKVSSVLGFQHISYHEGRNSLTKNIMEVKGNLYLSVQILYFVSR